MKFVLAFLICGFGFSSYSQDVTEISLQELEQKLNKTDENLQVFNFWASWCGPCMKELPFFAEANTRDNVDVTLVSLDFIQDIDRAKLALQKRGVTMDSYLLDAKDYIQKIDASWSGAIPATVIIDNKGNRYFYERSFGRQELKELIDSILLK